MEQDNLSQNSCVERDALINVAANLDARFFQETIFVHCASDDISVCVSHFKFVKLLHYSIFTF